MYIRYVCIDILILLYPLVDPGVYHYLFRIVIYTIVPPPHTPDTLPRIFITTYPGYSYERVIFPGVGGDMLKLGDFGLSFFITEPLHTICGTPTYVAPEIISETAAGYGLPVDMWAMGVISYIILCGYPPFASSSKNQKDLFAKIRTGKFTFPAAHWSHIPEDCKELIRALLTVDPAARCTAKQMRNHPWLSQGSPDRAINKSPARAGPRRWRATVDKLKALKAFQRKESLDVVPEAD